MPPAGVGLAPGCCCGGGGGGAGGGSGGGWGVSPRPARTREGPECPAIDGPVGRAAEQYPLASLPSY
jgi:hypothetical protein